MKYRFAAPHTSSNKLYKGNHQQACFTFIETLAVKGEELADLSEMVTGAGLVASTSSMWMSWAQIPAAVKESPFRLHERSNVL